MSRLFRAEALNDALDQAAARLGKRGVNRPAFAALKEAHDGL